MSAVPAASSASPQRVLTLPLVVFLGAVLMVLGYSLRAALVRPTAAEAIVQLADGDLDGEERQPLLRLLVEQGRASEAAAVRWAGAAAAVALGDRDGLGAVLAGGDVPKPLPAKDEREFLGLGDPLLGNLVAAWLAEGAGDRELAHVHWRRLSAQCRFVPRPLAEELAAAGLRRTG
jgi:hypothetical protein